MGRPAGKQQPPCIGRAGVQAGEQDHRQKAFHAKARQQKHYPCDAQDGVPHTVAEGRLLLPHPLHGPVHHAFQIHQRHGRGQRFQVKPGVRALVQQLCRRAAPHPEQCPGQRGEVAGEPQHPVQKRVEPFCLAQNVRLGDLRHQQHRKAAQQPEGKGKQRQGHAFQLTILLQCRAAPARPGQIDRKAGGHQHVLSRVQGAGQCPAAFHRPQDVPQAAARVGRADGLLPGKAAPGFLPVKQQHQHGRNRLAGCRGSQHQRAAQPHICPCRAGEGQHHQRNAHRLLGQLAEHIGRHPPPGQKKAAQHRRHRHPGHAQCRGLQCTGGAYITQPPFCRKASRGQLCRSCRKPQRQPGRQQAPQHPPGAAAVFRRAELLRHEPRCRHRHTRRGQRDEQRIHRQNQLIQAHALAAQRVCQPDAQAEPCQPQHHIRSGEQCRILQIALPHGAPPAQNVPVPAYETAAWDMLCKSKAARRVVSRTFLWYSKGAAFPGRILSRRKHTAKGLSSRRAQKENERRMYP